MSPPSQPDHDAYLSRAYLPELDGLRAFSVLIVISVHMKERVWEWLSGRLGVTVFFVLSGYLITMLALREVRARGRLNLRAFFVRRAFRLFPIYYLVLATYCLLIFGLGWDPAKRPMFAAALPYQLFYLQEFPFFLGIDGVFWNIPFYQSWSLGIEEKFYLAWPSLAFVALAGRPGARLAATAALAALAMAAPALIGEKFGRFFYPYSHILVGCLTALLLDSRAWFARLSRLGSPAAGAFALATFLGLHFAHPHVPSGWERAVHSIYTVVTATFLVTLILTDGPIRRFLRRGPLVAIGKLSYGMYLIHLLVLNAVAKVIRPNPGDAAQATASYLLTCALSVVAAYVLAVSVERPGIALGRRISARLIREGPDGPRGVTPHGPATA